MLLPHLRQERQPGCGCSCHASHLGSAKLLHSWEQSWMFQWLFPQPLVIIAAPCHGHGGLADVSSLFDLTGLVELRASSPGI